MSSPIHKFLFSPPPSPPLRPSDIDVTKSHGLTSLKSLVLPVDFNSGRNSLDRAEFDLNAQIRSPRTPQQRQFKFEKYPGSPSLYSRPTVIVEDVEATPRSPRVLNFDDPVTPKASAINSYKEEESTGYAPLNVPSTSFPLPSSLPRPVVRLLFLVSLLVSSIILLVYVPAARLPSLAAASTSRRLALAPDGRAYYDVANGVKSWEEAKERDYSPPQIKVPSMVKRSFASAGTNEVPRDKEGWLPANLPKFTRPYSSKRPIPNSHELLAVQSYLLQSTYNRLPTDVDLDTPLHADAVLSFGVHKLGQVGSDEEKAWLEELENERHDDIVIWYGGNGNNTLPHALLAELSTLHGPKRKPHLIPVHNRHDLPVLHAVLSRQQLDIHHHPLVMIGNNPISGDLELLEELRSSGKLREMLKAIGWLKVESTKEVRPIKKAKLKKRVLSELEHALKQA